MDRTASSSTTLADSLPVAPDSERYILGALVAWPGCAGDVFTKLRAADFVDRGHQLIFAALARQHVAGAIDPTLAAAELKDRPEFSGGSAAGYLLELGQGVATSVHVTAEAAKIIDARRKRQLYELAEGIGRSSLNGEPARVIVAAAKHVLSQLERDAPAEATRPQTLAALCEGHPHLRPPVIDGLARAGETVNVISHSKVGKSWLVYSLLLAEVTATPWLDRFNTSGGRALLVDNELHPSTLAFRIPAVGDAMALPRGEYADGLDVITLRGRLRSFADLAADLTTIEHGEYTVIVLDAKYRFVAAGASENDNASETLFYNLVDELADRTGAVVVLVHHTSKGSQSDKRVTDVGSGAGAQSRAADCHLILREHEDENAVVLAAAVRSFAPVDPLVLRWQFPLWVADHSADPARLKRPPSSSDQRQADRDREGIRRIIDALRHGPGTARQLRSQTGLSRDRQQRLFDQLHAEGHVTARPVTIRGNQTDEYRLNEDSE
jgi:hypothetical protein